MLLTQFQVLDEADASEKPSFLQKGLMSSPEEGSAGLN